MRQRATAGADGRGGGEGGAGQKRPSTDDGLQDYSRLHGIHGAALLIRERLITGFSADFPHEEIV